MEVILTFIEADTDEPLILPTHMMTEGRSSTRKTRRNCTTKAKTGCTVCKKRHVKCGEERPSCRRCRTGGWNCTYETVKSLQLEIFSDARERNSFDYFREHVATPLSGLAGLSFWNGVLFQLAYLQPAVKDAVVSLGALFESFHVQDINGDSAAAAQLRAYSLDKMLSCIRALQNDMSSVSAEALLTSCVLLATHQSFLGDVGMAIQHLRSGLKLVRERPLLAYKSKSVPEVLSRTILPEISRLEIRLLLVHNPRGNPGLYPEAIESSWSGPPPPALPVAPRIESIKDVSALLEDLLQHLVDNMHHKSSGESHNASTHQEDLDVAYNRLLMVENQSKIFYEANQNTLAPIDQHFWALTRIRMCLARIFLLTFGVVEECVFDRHTECFAEVLRWVKKYIDTRPKIGQRTVLVGHDIESLMALRKLLYRSSHHCLQSGYRTSSDVRAT